MIEVKYFARLREALGKDVESFALPEGVQDVGALTGYLKARGGAWQHELAPGRAFRVAVNQDMAEPTTALRDGDEVAYFPPVTGG
jgi:molybdopterin synthase sulfur carrier subunit